MIHKSPPGSPSGHGRKRAPDGPPPGEPDRHKQARTDAPDNGPPGSPLLSVPVEFRHRIAWHMSDPHAPIRFGPHLPQARAQAEACRGALLPLTLVNQQLAKDMAVLMRMARWAWELARLWYPGTAAPQAPVDFLLSDPSDATPEIPDGYLRLERTSLQRQRAEALLQFTLSAGRAQFKRELLKGLFMAHCAQAHPQVARLTKTSHLALDRLHERVIANEHSLNPTLRRLGGINAVAPDAREAPLGMLLCFVADMQPALRFMFVLSLALVFDTWNSPQAQAIQQHLLRHGERARSLLDQVQQCRQELLDKDAGFAPERVREVLRHLQRTPCLGMEAGTRLLLKLCGNAELRQAATDTTLIGLIQRALREIGTEPDMLGILRLECYFAALPEDLGLAAFQGLDPAHRLALVEATYGVTVLPYIAAVVTAHDIAFAQRQAALDDMIARAADDDPQHPLLDPLNKLKRLLNQEDAARGGT